MTRRPRRGPFNAIIDPTEFGAGSAPIDISEAVKQSGNYDIWDGNIEMLDLKVRSTVCVCYLRTKAPKICTKAPSTSHPRSMIELPAISTPHQGTSYNPPAEAHHDLLRSAHEVEEEAMKGADKGQDVRERIMQARQQDHVTEEGLPPGMALHGVNEDEEEEPVTALVKPAPVRKTKQQRRKVKRVVEEVRFSSLSRANQINLFINDQCLEEGGG